MKPDLCIYHGPGCMDGLVAGWTIWKRWPDIEFVAAQYGDAPPDVTGKRVLIVDFSYKRDVLVDLSLEARGILVLDHHKSAQADLAAFIGLGQPFEIPLTAVFDMNRSGARLAWDYADDDGHPPPLLVNLVEDRDLWRFALGPLTRFTHAVLASLPETFESVDQVAQTLVHNAGMIEDQGAAILRQSDKDVQRMIAVSRRAMTIAGHPVPVVNAPPWMASEIGNILAVGHAFAATYYDTASGKRSFSLRSEASGADVSEIASRFGGGGHAHAAGFAMPLGWEGDAE